MFTRSTSYILNASKAELKKSGVRYTAQSKKNRIEVQLLKDFPGIGVKGQVVAVKASAMTDFLYPNNGATYMNHKNAQPAIPVVSKAAAAAAAAALKAAQALEKKNNKAKTAKLNPVTKSKDIETEKKKSLLSLDDLLAIDVNVLSKENLDLVFAKLPRKLVILRRSKNNALESSIDKQYISNQVEIALSRYVRESDITQRFFQNESTSIDIKNENGESVESIQSLGSYYADVKYEDREQTISIIINAK